MYTGLVNGSKTIKEIIKTFRRLLRRRRLIETFTSVALRYLNYLHKRLIITVLDYLHSYSINSILLLRNRVCLL